MIFRKWGGGAKAVWNFSEVSSVLVWPPVPKKHKKGCKNTGAKGKTKNCILIFPHCQGQGYGNSWLLCHTLCSRRQVRWAVLLHILPQFLYCCEMCQNHPSFLWKGVMACDVSPVPVPFPVASAMFALSVLCLECLVPVKSFRQLMSIPLLHADRLLQQMYRKCTPTFTWV